jgi:hypothetical protein
MKKMLVLLLLLLLSLLLLSMLPAVWVAHAQQAPLIFLINQDLWTWASGDSALTPLTTDAYVRDVALSPDGTRLAALVLSPVTIDAVQRVGGFSGYWPVDITIIKISTGAITTVATQPDDARLFAADGSPDNAWLRGLPAWSPDGTKLAWTEMHYPTFAPEENRLVIYDTATGTAQPIVTGLPEPAGAGPVPISVIWSDAGIALWVPNYDAATSTFPTDFLIYSPDGTLLSQTRVPDDSSKTVTEFDWITTPQGAQLGLLFGDGTWELVDPATGTRRPAAAPVERYSLLAPDTSLALRFSIDPNANDYWQNHDWDVVYPDGRTVPLTYHGHDLLLSSDGNSYAYVDQNGVISINDTLTSAVVQTASLALGYWGPTGWRLGAGTVPNPPAAACPGAPSPRLIVGAQARVMLNTAPNNVRDTPVSGAVLGQIPPGGAFSVLAGPTCANAMNWWQVNYNGMVGWTAEGDAGGYWLEPLP